MTGYITGISYAKDGYLFPVSKIDASLSAKKLFPNQHTMVPFSELTDEEKEIVKSGGVVKRFNNQLLHGAVAPEIPLYVQERRTRDMYHKAIEQADKCESRTAYMLNIVGLALDPKCGPPEKRASDIAPYVIDERTNKMAEVDHILEVVHKADEEAKQQVGLFKRFINFLRNLLNRLLNFKKHPIIAEKGREKLRWSDIRGDASGKLVGLANNVQASIEKAHNSFQEKQAFGQKDDRDAARHQAPAQGNDQTRNPQNSDHKQKGADGTVMTMKM